MSNLDIDEIIKNEVFVYLKCKRCDSCRNEWQQLSKLLKEGNYEEVLTRGRRILELIVYHELADAGIDIKNYGVLDAAIGNLEKFKGNELPKLIVTHMKIIKDLGNFGPHPYKIAISTEINYVINSLLIVFYWHKNREFKTFEYIDIHETKTQEIHNLPQYFSNVTQVHERIDNIIYKLISQDKAINIKNIGLDWETVWPRLRYNILDPDKCFKNFTYRGLIIDYKSKELKKLCESIISIDTAKTTIEKIIKYLQNNQDFLKLNNINLLIRKYNVVPIIHGFNINDEYLFFSFTRFKNSELAGGDGFYLYCKFEKGNKISEYYFEVFSSWFDYIFNNSKEI